MIGVCLFGGIREGVCLFVWQLHGGGLVCVDLERVWGWGLGRGDEGGLVWVELGEVVLGKYWEWMVLLRVVDSCRASSEATFSRASRFFMSAVCWAILCFAVLISTLRVSVRMSVMGRLLVRGGGFVLPRLGGMYVMGRGLGCISVVLLVGLMGFVLPRLGGMYVMGRGLGCISVMLLVGLMGGSGVRLG